MSLTLDIEQADKAKETLLTLMKGAPEAVADILRGTADELADLIADWQGERERQQSLSQAQRRAEFGGDQA